MNARSNPLRFPLLSATLVALSLASPPAASAGTITEPHTVFYGKVLGTASAQDFLITSGDLVWTIRRSDGQVITLRTTLFPLHNNTYSYRLDVPHSAIALGLSGGATGLPLPPTPAVHLHETVTVDGQSAILLGPATSAFTTEQLLRTATYRMDLGLHRTAVDSDGDGIPDWWEDLHGLDKQNPNDAQIDFSGDGLTALEAYLRGLDPHHDNRMPNLLTGEIVVYPAGRTAVLLETADLDSGPDQLTYTLTRLPPAGTLTLRNVYANPEAPDRVLELGDSFTQADLFAGRLLYDHTDDQADPGSFGVSVRDENPAHPADEGDVLLLVYRASDLIPETLPPLEARRLDLHLLAMSGYVIMDASALSSNRTVSTPSANLAGQDLDDYFAAYGPDLSYAVVSDGGAISLAIGGHADDVLTAGTRGTLRGGAGADWFVFESFEKGRVTLADFSPVEHDVIDFSRLPAASGGWVHDVIRLIKVNGAWELQTSLQSGAFTNLSVALPGLSDADADLYTLIESDRLLVGGLHLEPRLSVVASEPLASENGPTPGRFTITRQGRLDSELTVNFVLSGTAQNGTDYVFVPSTVTLPEGSASANIEIMPYQDAHTEPTEYVHLTLSPGTGYRIGAANQATVAIEDLRMLVDIEVLEPIAVRDSGSPAVILITRRDVINQDVLIRIDIGGTAVNGTHYNNLPTFHTMGINQTTLLLSIVPKPGAAIPGGLATVDISVRTSTTYRVVGDARASVSIVERMDSFAGWRLREFPDASDDLAAFAAGDANETGITHFQRYAFGLDPHNPDRTGLPNAMLLDGNLVVSYRRPPGIQDVVYRVVGSSDLAQWSANLLPAAQIAPPPGATDPARVYYKVEADGNTAFATVELELVP